MLLTALYEKAVREDLLEKQHLQDRDVHIVIPIKGDGTLSGDSAIPLYSKDKRGKDVLGQEKTTFRFPGENNGGKAFFVVESCCKILGIDAQTCKGVSVAGKRNNQAKAFAHYWQRIEDAFAATKAPVLGALIGFKEKYVKVREDTVVADVPFVRLKNERKGQVVEIKILDEWISAGSCTATFSVDGLPVLAGDGSGPVTEYWKDEYKRQAYSHEEEDDATGKETKRGLCLVTGRNEVLIARSHKPKILGVPGASTGGYIVSFAEECPSFSSYGFTTGENAPVSEDAVAAYALALQSLIANEHNSLRIGPALFCFWVKDSPKEASLFRRMLQDPDPTEVEHFLKAPFAGIDRRILQSDRFYSVSLSANQGRIVVRQWMQESLEQARVNLREWFADLDVVHFSTRRTVEGPQRKEYPTKVGEVSPLSLAQLARSTTRDPKKVQRDTVARLYTAALGNTDLPCDMIAQIIERLRSDIAKHGSGILETPISVTALRSIRDSGQPVPPAGQSRIALLRLIINRLHDNRKEGDPMIESKVFETDDAAYNCGRLLAILAETQAKAHEYSLEGPGVAERYFGTASVSPSSVFPILLRLNRHHLNKIRKSDRYRSHAGAIEESIQNIVVLFRPETSSKTPQFPRHLDLQAQGRFAIGFYQQKADNEARRAEAKREKELSAK